MGSLLYFRTVKKPLSYAVPGKNLLITKGDLVAIDPLYPARDRKKSHTLYAINALGT